VGEKFDEVENLRRVGSLARDKLVLRHGKTLRGRWVASRTESIKAREGRAAEARATAEGRKTLERENPKRAPRTATFNREADVAGVSGGARP
jgi:hypothetical protein